MVRFLDLEGWKGGREGVFGWVFGGVGLGLGLGDGEVCGGLWRFVEVWVLRGLLYCIALYVRSCGGGGDGGYSASKNPNNDSPVKSNTISISISISRVNRIPYPPTNHSTHQS